jgi:hypothetical protein
MKIQHFDEPELAFGAGQHIDIRFGLMSHGPLDVHTATAPKSIRVGIIGSNESSEGLHEWLEKCRSEIAAKDSRQPNLFPRFPGFNRDTAFRSELVLDQAFNAEITRGDVDAIGAISSKNKAVEQSVRVFEDAVRHVIDKQPPDVLLCAVPDAMLKAMSDQVPDSDDASKQPSVTAETPQHQRLDFHDLLKAKCMELLSARPMQIVLPATYDATKRRRKLTGRKEIKPIQDEATRAWNIHTALYYKAGGIPWRLQDEVGKLTTCFVGVGFYFSLDRERILTSVAQVFNNRGNGVVVRGGPATVSKDDRQIHLGEADARGLMERALNQYRIEHKTLPARVVIHKTSSHNDDERRGFRAAIDAAGVHSCEMLSLKKGFTRLFRSGEYPPLRGTFLTLDDSSQILYTRGSVDFFATYPGMYMPRPLFIGCDSTDSTPKYLGQEILALTKMNWNHTQFDGGMPITIRAARQVGDILRHTTSEKIQPAYSHYM